MRASIVIPTFNRLDQLQNVIAAVRGQARPPDTDLEVVVVDDGSSDGTSDWLETQIGNPGFRAIHQPNSGPARARNRGVEAASGDLILFLGDDTVPQPGWLAAHLEEHRLFGRSWTAGGARVHLLLTRYREPIPAIHQRIWRPIRVPLDRRSPCGALQFLLHVEYFPSAKRTCQVGRISRGFPGGGLGRYRVCLSRGRATD